MKKTEYAYDPPAMDVPAAFLDYLTSWWNMQKSPNERTPSVQPAPMTYDEVMAMAPQRRYGDALDDDDDSSGDEDDMLGEDEDEERDMDKVLALHQDMQNERDGVEESKT